MCVHLTCVCVCVSVCDGVCLDSCVHAAVLPVGLGLCLGPCLFWALVDGPADGSVLYCVVQHLHRFLVCSRDVAVFSCLGLPSAEPQQRASPQNTFLQIR